MLSELEHGDQSVEVVEHKGLGHPDTICDALAETLSRNLCREYQDRFGRVLRHNVDKALLCAGQSTPAFGGGAIVSPITVYLAGRATTKVGSQTVPLDEIAIEGSRSWLRTNLHALDPDQHVRIHTRIHPGSQDLQALFSNEPNRSTRHVSSGCGADPDPPNISPQTRVSGQNSRALRRCIVGPRSLLVSDPVGAR